MLLSFVAAFMKRQPYLPLDPGTIVGRMYYVCDSWMTRDFGAMGGDGLDRGQETGGNMRNTAHLRGQRYVFGKMTGVSGTERIGIDYAGTPKAGV